MATYAQMMQKVATLPSILTRMGANLERFSATSGPTYQGWALTGRPFDNYDGADWRHDLRLMVDTEGHLWQYERYQHYEDDGTATYRERFLAPVSAGDIQRWDSQGWEMLPKLEAALSRF